MSIERKKCIISRVILLNLHRPCLNRHSLALVSVNAGEAKLFLARIP
jgi:hypothetical protein